MRRKGQIITGLAFAAITSLFASCSDVDVYPTASRTLPPDAIDDAALVFDASTSEAVLVWTAPAANGGTRGIARYDIRAAYTDTLVWEAATVVADPPQPAPAGTHQTYRFRYPERGRPLAATIRSIDTSGNFSGPGNVARTRIPGYVLSGAVLDVFSREPVVDVPVALSGFFGNRGTVTDADGRWTLDDLTPGSSRLRIGSSAYAPVEIEFILASDRVFIHQLIPQRSSDVIPSLTRLTLFKEALGLSSGRTVLRKWTAFPLKAYVPEFTSEGGLDYHAAALAAMDRWSELVGESLFAPVAEVTGAEVVLSFETPEQMGIQTGVTSYENTPDGHPKRSLIRVVNVIENPPVLRRVLLHELGHSLRLRHMPSGFLMYGSHPLPDDPTDDEIWIVRLLLAIDDLTNMEIYPESTP
jgi:hypothetical protein